MALKVLRYRSRVRTSPRVQEGAMIRTLNFQIQQYALADLVVCALGQQSLCCSCEL